MASRDFLCIDTSTSSVLAEVVCLDGDERLSKGVAVTEGATLHGESLAPNIKIALARAGIGVDALAGVIVGLGPGPFTGLRVGIVTAASIADAAGIPVYGVCSLDGFDVSSGRVFVATDARRKEIYWATYADGRRTLGPAVNTASDVLEQLQPATFDRGIVAGAGKYALYLEQLGSMTEARPTGIGLLDAMLRNDSLSRDPAPLTPLYLRRPDAKVPLPSVKSASQPTSVELKAQPR